MSTGEKDGRRVYDKKNSCYYCEKEFGKVGRHLFQVHKNEKEVAKIIALDKNDRMRQLLLDKLCRLGNFNHNLKVLEIHEGELKVMRRPAHKEDNDPSNYLPCQFCHGFFQKKDLYRHCPKCPFAEDGNQMIRSKKLQHAGRLLLAANKYPTGASQQLSDNVISIMAMDDVSAVVKTDETILRVCSTLIENRGNEKAVEVSQQMRILARLLIKVRELSGVPTLSLENCLTPPQFDNLLVSARYLGGYTGAPNTSADHFKSHSTAAKCGYALKKAAFAVKGKALRKKDMEAKKDVDLFLELYEGEWSAKVTTQALQNLSFKKHNKPQFLPITNDLLALRAFLNENILKLTEEVEKNPMKENWRKLANYALARMIIFNKRRGTQLFYVNVLQEYCSMSQAKHVKFYSLPNLSLLNYFKIILNEKSLLTGGEASRMTLDSFQGRPLWQNVHNEEILSALSASEKELCKRYVKIVDLI